TPQGPPRSAAGTVAPTDSPPDARRRRQDAGPWRAPDPRGRRRGRRLRGHRGGARARRSERPDGEIDPRRARRDRGMDAGRAGQRHRPAAGRRVRVDSERPRTRRGTRGSRPGARAAPAAGARRPRGPFSLGDPERVRGILSRAGFEWILTGTLSFRQHHTAVEPPPAFPYGAPVADIDALVLNSVNASWRRSIDA